MGKEGEGEGKGKRGLGGRGRNQTAIFSRAFINGEPPLKTTTVQ